jgi:hypothetical protein
MKVQAITTFERKTGRRASTKQWPQWYHLDIFRHLEFISYHSTVLICTHLYSTYSTFVCRFGATTNKSQSTARRQEDQLVATLEVRATLYLTQLYDTLRHLTKVLYKSTLQVLCWSVWSVLVRFGPIWSDLVHLVSLFSRGCKSCTVFSLCLSIPQLVCPIKASVNRKTTQDRVKAGFILLLLPLVEAC